MNTTLRENYGERGLIISSMMTLGYCSQIWVPLFTFPTVEAPRFPHGYPAATVFEVMMWSILMFGTWFMVRWKRRHPDLEMRLAVEAAEGENNLSTGTDTNREGADGKVEQANTQAREVASSSLDDDIISSHGR